MKNSLVSGFNSYYEAVTSLGFIGITHLQKLIVANWIYKVLIGEYGFIEDSALYNKLNDLYSYLEGDCLIPYKNYCKNFMINRVPRSSYIRITEADSAQRVTEEKSDLRTL